MASKMIDWEVTVIRSFYTVIKGVSSFEGSWNETLIVSATSEAVAEKRAGSKLKNKYGKKGITYYNEWEISSIRAV